MFTDFPFTEYPQIPLLFILPKKHGTSMGSAVAPSLANLFVYGLKKTPFHKEPYLTHIKQYFRYVNDTFMCDGPLNKLFKEHPRFAYKRGAFHKDILCLTQPLDTKNLTEGKPKLDTFTCMDCNCCSSFIKAPNIHHLLSGVEIKLRAYATCKSKYVIYALKCICVMLYVGKTILPVNMHIKEHKHNIRNFKKDSYTDYPRCLGIFAISTIVPANLNGKY
ncbi:hypothetical protein XELAEV_18024968mg [Xenopus laevis]|uniref:Reverse transcriptase domain-containing protein n=1 Tax=Xenopus laevis TaxID=8355 RepID=A0A974CZU7_XENLA|nr:hypothetical protein XELAEV_18024968mg [Xenopus laevis]